MAEYHCPVPGGPDEDKIVLFMRRHWASFLGYFLLSFLMLVVPAVALIMAYIYQRNFFQGILLNFIILGFSAYYLVAVTVALTSWMTFYYDIYIICTDAIVDIRQQGFFGRKTSQLAIVRVQDVSSEIKGILPTLFGYGDVLVETAGEQTQNFLLEGIANPQEVSNQILELHAKFIGDQGGGEPDLILAREKSKPPPPPAETSAETPYQELLEKDKILKEPERSSDKSPSGEEGEVSKDDLEKGGQIDLQ